MASLIKYEAACRALQEAVAVDEVKDLRDKADAMRVYAMQAKNKSLEVDAAEIRIRAERRLGEMISEQKANGGLNTGAKGIGPIAVVSDDRNKAPKLSDDGISKDLSSRAQKLAAVPADEFEAEVGEWRERVKAEGSRVTTRLELAGARAIQEQEFSDPDAGASDAEILFAEEHEREALATVYKLTEVAASDDQLGAALTLVNEQATEIARLKAQVRMLEESRDGHMNKGNELIRTIKSLRLKLAHLEKAAA